MKMISKSPNSRNIQFRKILKLSEKYLIVLLAMIFFGGNISFAQSDDCPSAPESCFSAPPDGETTQPFAGGDHCSEKGKKITLDQSILDLLDIPNNTNPVSVADLQLKIIGHYTPNSGYCTDASLLVDGKYGLCTKATLDKYLEKKCEEGKVTTTTSDTSNDPTNEENAADDKTLTEVTAENKLNQEIIAQVVDADNKPLSGVKIHIPELNSQILDIDKKLEENLTNNYKANLEKMKTSLDELKKHDPPLLIEKNGQSYFITNKKGELTIKNLFVTNEIKIYTYILYYSDKTGIYKTKKIHTESLPKIYLGILKMYKDCEGGTGNTFDADCLFPAWSSKGDNEASHEEIQGVYGKNNDGKIAMTVIPNIIDIILKFISPIVVGMFIFSGIKFIYAGSDEEDLNSAKDFFLYGGIGLAFIIMSYSLMKVIYFLLK